MKLVGLGLVALVVSLMAGCGGDAYETQFKASLEQLKDTGQPIPRSEQATAPSPEAAADIEKLQGTWKAVSVQMDGADQPEYVKRGFTWIFKGKTFTNGLNAEQLKKNVGRYRIDPTKNPKEFEGLDGDKAIGIYSLEGDTLKLCTAPNGAERPTSFATKKGDQVGLVVLKRVQN